jgi:hypothetical protein
LAVALLGLCLTAAPGALLAKEKLTVDLVNEPSSLDPHVQPGELLRLSQHLRQPHHARRQGQYRPAGRHILEVPVGY